MTGFFPTSRKEKSLRATEGNTAISKEEIVIARSVEDSFALLGTGWQSHAINCHCKERCDVAISTFFSMRLLRPCRARNDMRGIFYAPRNDIY
jgi:hypothetical protein